MNYDRKREELERKREQMNRILDQKRTQMNARFDEAAAELGPTLSVRQQEIVEAALILLAENGLNNLSLRDIAKRLNMQAPALYWHFKRKEELIDVMAEAILLKKLTTIPVRRADERWQDWLIAHMLLFRAAMLAYPDGGRVVAGAHLYPALTLGRSFEAILESLASAGVDLLVARHIGMTATHYTFGNVIEEQAAPSPDVIEAVQTQNILAQYPYMAQVMGEVWERDEPGGEEEYVIGLRMIIDGAERLRNE